MMLLRSLVLLALVTPAAALAQLRWIEGTHYQAIAQPPAAAAQQQKIEVTEVFSYGCPYCFQAMSEIRRLKASLPADVAMTFLPASFMPAEAWPMFQRAYLTAQSFGIAEANHERLFVAIWETGEFPLVDPATNRLRRPLPTIEDAAAFYAKHSSVSAADFVARANSPEIEAQMKRADQTVAAWKVPGTPAIVVNGRYLVNSEKVGSWDGIRQLVDYLVGQERLRLKLPMPPKR